MLYALEYSIGRMTFAPQIVMKNIKQNIHMFSDYELGVIVKTIKNHEGSYGMRMDEVKWFEFLDYIKGVLHKRNSNKTYNDMRMAKYSLRVLEMLRYDDYPEIREKHLVDMFLEENGIEILDYKYDHRMIEDIILDTKNLINAMEVKYSE